jgi:hypothetical protein
LTISATFLGKRKICPKIEKIKLKKKKKEKHPGSKEMSDQISNACNKG